MKYSYPRSKRKDSMVRTIIYLMRHPDATITELRHQCNDVKGVWQTLRDEGYININDHKFVLNWPLLQRTTYIVSNGLYNKLATSWWRNYYRAKAEGLNDDEAAKVADRKDKRYKQRKKHTNNWYQTRRANYKTKAERAEEVNTDPLSLRNILLGGTDNGQKERQDD